MFHYHCFLSLALKYSILCVQENQEEMELYMTNQLLVYADNINLLNENKTIIQKSTVSILEISK